MKTLSFWKKKLSFDDILMTTWKQENERQRNKDPRIPQLRLGPILHEIHNQKQSNIISSAFVLHSHAMISWVFCHITKLLTSNPLKPWKNQREQSTFFPGYIQNFSGYSRLKVLVVTKVFLMLYKVPWADSWFITVLTKESAHATLHSIKRTLVVSGKKYWLFPRIFFWQSNQVYWMLKVR